MPRTKGAKNVIPLEARDSIPTTDTKSVKHLARQIEDTPVEQFKALLGHQSNYLKWIDSRHQELQEAKRELNPDGRGPKDSVYRKYRWYAGQQCLLEAINAFEVFYKRTFIALAEVMRRQIPPERIKGSVDAKTLWVNRGTTSFPALIFESLLFHDLEQVDKASDMLIEARRYNPNNRASPMQGRVRALKAAFQIRHTLSHNQGLVTQSDEAKFQALSFEISKQQAIDPSIDDLGSAVTNLLSSEANQFTDFLLDSAAKLLRSQNESGGVSLPIALRKNFEKRIGMTSSLRSLPWT